MDHTHSDVQSLTEDWKVGPFVPRGVGLIPLGLGCLSKFEFSHSSLHHMKKMSLTPSIQGKSQCEAIKETYGNIANQISPSLSISAALTQKQHY